MCRTPEWAIRWRDSLRQAEFEWGNASAQRELNSQRFEHVTRCVLFETQVLAILAYGLIPKVLLLTFKLRKSSNKRLNKLLRSVLFIIVDAF